VQLALTGYKGGIGRALHTHMIRERIDWVLIDRGDGIDVREIDVVFDKIKNCDIFINNVYCENTQNELFTKWVEYNRDKLKLCINIGSAVANTDNEMFYTESYYKNKKQLHTLTKEWNANNAKCVASLVVPNFCDTAFAGKDVYQSEKVLTHLRNKFYKLKEEGKLIKPVAVAKTIKFLINEWLLNNHISNIEIRN